jgi:hypothetical protein
MTVAPSDETVGSPRGQSIGNYNLTQTWETGYRWNDLSGNTGKYRSDVNFRDGLSLLGSRLTLNSKDGRGGWLDDLLLQTQGLGSDPYQYANLRIGKNRLYRYDMLWRLNAYYNPALPISGGAHFMDTTRRLQDHDLTILPQSKVRFFVGFTRASQSGPALSTVQLFDSFSGGEFVLQSDVRRRQNEFRIGNEIRLGGFKLHWIRAWEQFAEDTPFYTTGPGAAAPPQGQARLDSLRRTEPYTGSTPSWRVNLMRESAKVWGLNGRFTYSSGRRNFLLDEMASGLDRFGGARNRQVLVAGEGRRPVASGNFTASYFPTDRLTISNHTGYHNTRMEGDARYSELENAQGTLTSLNFESLGIRNVTNVTDAQFRITEGISLRGGYQFAERRIQSVERTELFGFENLVRSEQTNRLHAGMMGFRLQPMKGLSVLVDGELGRHSTPFYPTSEKDYHGFGARVLYRARGLTLSALGRSNANFNSVSLFSHSARVRQYSFDAAWAGNDWISFEAGYSKLHNDSATGLAYFLANALVQRDRSLWISNLHAGHAGTHLKFKSRADLYVGLSYTQDTGDGRASLSVPPAGADPGSGLAAFREVQTFPMRFFSPLARFSVKVHPKVRLNLGYQHYGYRENLLADQNYHAHTGFVSVLWTF